MATGTMRWYRKGLTSILSGSVDYLTSVIKVALVSGTYSIPDTATSASQDGHDFFNHVRPYEVGRQSGTATGYTAGGYTLANKSIGTSTGGIARLINSADPSWASSYIRARGCVVWASTTAASATSPLLGWANFSATVESSNGTFTLDLDATNGILYVNAS